MCNHGDGANSDADASIGADDPHRERPLRGVCRDFGDAPQPELAAPDRLTELLVAYQAALVVGADGSRSTIENQDLESESTIDFKRAQTCLRLLEQARLAALDNDGNDAASISMSAAFMRDLCHGSADASWAESSVKLGDATESKLPRELLRIGRFEILRELGSGAHGVVLLAHDPELQRTLALKMPRPETLMAPDARRRFAREAQAAARLKHPNLVPVYEVGQVGPIYYIASAYCPGPTLAAWLAARNRPVSIRCSAQWILLIARAVHYAHSHGVLHRDLKPGNVLLSPRSQEGQLPSKTDVASDEEWEFDPQVTDFGLAKLSEGDGTNTQSGTVLGTIAYMSPEQAAGRLDDIGSETDVYALGAILYEMLTGRPPFTGPSDIETLRQVHAETPISPRRLRAGVPRELETICLACLEKEPQRRYATAGALADDLDRFLHDLPLGVRPPTLFRRGRLWVRRHPARAVIIAVILAAVIGLPAGLAAHSIRLHREHAAAVAAQLAAEESERVARQSEALVREHVYVADMRVIQQLHHDGDLASLAPLLDRHGPAVGGARGLTKLSTSRSGEETAAGANASARRQAMPFEWRYLDRFRNACRLTIDAHHGPVDLLAFACEGHVLATSGLRDAQLRLWDIPSGHLLGTFSVRTSPARRWEEEAAALSRDGRRVAILGDAFNVIVWDVASHTEVARFQHQNTVLAVAFSPDGECVAAGDEKETILWSCNTHKPVSTHPPARLLAFAPDGQRLAVVGPQMASNTVHLCDLPSNPRESDLSLPAPVRYVTYSPDGTMMACLIDTSTGGSICVYHARTGATLYATMALRDERYSRMRFSGDSRWLVASAADGSLKIWDGRTGQPHGALRGPATRLTDSTFTSDNRWLATATPQGSILIWDRQLLDACDPLVPDNEVIGPLAFTADGKHLAACTPVRDVLVIDVAQGQVVARLVNHVDWIRDLRFSPDGERLLTTDGETMRCWNWHDEKVQWQAAGHRATCVCWSPRANLVASSGFDQLIHLRDANDGSEKAIWTAHADVKGLYFLPDRPLLVSGGRDGMIRFWDFAKGERFGRRAEEIDPEVRRRDIESGDPQVADFPVGTPVEQFVIASDGRALAVVDLDGGLTVRALTGSLPADQTLFSVRLQGKFPTVFTLTPDGSTLGMGNLDGVFQAFDMKSRETRYTLSGRRVGGTSVAYSPDARTLATVSREGSLTLWDLTNWQTHTIGGAPLLAVRSLAFSPDGKTLAVATDDSVLADRPDDDSVRNSPNVRRFVPKSSATALLTNRSISVDSVPWDASGPGFRLWNVASSSEHLPIGSCPTVTAIPFVAWSSRGTLAAGSHDGTVWIWNPQTKELVTRFSVNSRGFDATSWRPESGQPPVGRGMLKSFDGVAALAFSADGAKLAVATQQGVVQIVDTSDWTRHTTLCTDATDAGCLVFSPSGTSLLANRRGQLLCWDLLDPSLSPTPIVIGDAESSVICSAVFAQDGRHLALGRADGTVQLFDTHGFGSRRRFSLEDAPPRMLTGHLDRVVSMSFSPDGKTLVTGSWDATVRLWHAASGQEVAVLKAHHSKVEAVVFSSDGSVLATGGQRDADHGEVFLWRAAQ